MAFWRRCSVEAWERGHFVIALARSGSRSQEQYLAAAPSRQQQADRGNLEGRSEPQERTHSIAMQRIGLMNYESLQAHPAPTGSCSRCLVRAHSAAEAATGEHGRWKPPALHV